MKSIADVLADTRKYLEDHGWIKGSMKDRHGRVCLRGGIYGAMGVLNNTAMNPDTSYRIAEIEQTIIKRGNLNDSIPGWNDRPGRTQQEVLDLLAKVEKIERAGFDPDEGVQV